MSPTRTSSPRSSWMAPVATTTVDQLLAGKTGGPVEPSFALAGGKLTAVRRPSGPRHRDGRCRCRAARSHVLDRTGPRRRRQPHRAAEVFRRRCAEARRRGQRPDIRTDRGEGGRGHRCARRADAAFVARRHRQRGRAGGRARSDHDERHAREDARRRGHSAAGRVDHDRQRSAHAGAGPSRREVLRALGARRALPGAARAPERRGRPPLGRGATDDVDRAAERARHQGGGLELHHAPQGRRGASDEHPPDGRPRAGHDHPTG